MESVPERNRLRISLWKCATSFDAGGKKSGGIQWTLPARLIATAMEDASSRLLYNYLSNAVKFTQGRGIGGCIHRR